MDQCRALDGHVVGSIAEDDVPPKRRIGERTAAIHLISPYDDG